MDAAETVNDAFLNLVLTRFLPVALAMAAIAGLAYGVKARWGQVAGAGAAVGAAAGIVLVWQTLL